VACFKQAVASAFVVEQFHSRYTPRNYWPFTGLVHNYKCWMWPWMKLPSCWQLHLHSVTCSSN